MQLEKYHQINRELESVKLYFLLIVGDSVSWQVSHYKICGENVGANCLIGNGHCSGKCLITRFTQFIQYLQINTHRKAEQLHSILKVILINKHAQESRTATEHT
jgi:hypothetical protein